MKKFLGLALSVSMAISALPCMTASADNAKQTETVSYTYSAGEAKTYTREMEKLNRGLVAVKSGSGVYLSWRLLDGEDFRFGSSPNKVTFNVYRGSEKIAEVTDSTNYTDSTAGQSYSVAPVINGTEGEKCEAVSVWNSNYIDIPLVKPADETIKYTIPYTDDNGNTSESATFSFFPADCSTGDVDGDGEYEIIVKWTSSERDVGSPGDPAYSGTVHLAAYKLDGTKLWKNDIELGTNVYSSAHTVQFLVYDFDLDGKAEVMCQTSLGSKDAEGRYVSNCSSDSSIAAISEKDNAETDYRGYGRIINGREFLTVFSGLTGEAIDTIDLPTSRGSAFGVDYGDDFGNRSNRFLANVAYLDGVKPYAVYLRGYYFGRNKKQRTSIAGVSFDGKKLSPDYRFDTQIGQPGYYEGAYQYVGNGNHNCTVADVDNDGKDEFITGALCMEVKDDNTFKPRWCTFMEHGDALHIGDYDPTHPGFEFFTVHEDAGPNTMSGKEVQINFGMSVIDADNGDIMLHVEGSDDTGRGVMANTGAGGFFQAWSARTSPYQSNGGTNFSVMRNFRGASQNFRIFWDGDLYDNLLDGTGVTDWNGNGFDNIFSADGCVKINGTKSNPALQADLFGDWREELVYPTKNGSSLRVFTTTTETKYKIKTLMHDPVYRSGVAAEQTAYNQPPHVGMYLSDDVFFPPAQSISIKTLPAKTVYVPGEELETDGLVVEASYADGSSSTVSSYTVSGYDKNKTGKQTITVTYMNKTAVFEVDVKAIEKIAIVTPPSKTLYITGDELDTSGMLVRAYFEGDVKRDVTDYTVSGYDANKVGEQTITVEYSGKTAEFNVTVKKVTGISVISAPENTEIYEGQPIDTAGLVVEAQYSDGTSGEITDYTLSYDSSIAGKQSVVVKYYNQTASFDITVKTGAYESLNDTYETDSTAPTLTNKYLGILSGDFVMEHTMTITSMPADCTGNKDDTNGFFLRFRGNKQTGGGWYLLRVNNSESRMNLCWKNTKATKIASVEIGKTYTLTYNFHNVANGQGASVDLTVTDSDGTVIASVPGLNLRNFTDTDMGRYSPITYVDIYNQANAGKTAGVTIADTAVYKSSKIQLVDGRDITAAFGELDSMMLIAAKYDENKSLTAVDVITPKKAGKCVYTADFVPDKVFLWKGAEPMDAQTAPFPTAPQATATPEPTVTPKATSTTESTATPKATAVPTVTETPAVYSVTITVTDKDNVPVEGATVRIQPRRTSGGGEVTETAAPTSAPASAAPVSLMNAENEIAAGITVNKEIAVSDMIKPEAAAEIENGVKNDDLYVKIDFSSPSSELSVPEYGKDYTAGYNGETLTEAEYNNLINGYTDVKMSDVISGLTFKFYQDNIVVSSQLVSNAGTVVTGSATVSSGGSSSAVIAEAVTDANGVAVFENIPDGNYQIRANHSYMGSGWLAHFIRVNGKNATTTIKMRFSIADINASATASPTATENPSATAEPVSTAIPSATAAPATYTQKIMSAQPSDKNYIVSPLSIKMAMLMTANGAEGETQSEIANAFGVSDVGSFNAYAKDLAARLNESTDLSVNLSNSIWFNKDYFSNDDADFSDSFKQTVAEYYNGNAESVNNQTLGPKINSWISEKTNGKITNFMSENPADAASISSALINTVYMNARWSDEFSKSATTKDIFKDINGEDHEMDFMHRTSAYAYYSDSDTRMVQIPYQGGLSMWIVLGDSSTFEADKKLADYTEIDLSIPKFITEYEINCSDALKAMGISKAFENENHDFDGMFVNLPSAMKLERIMQKALISVDEEGTEAAAVTVVEPAPGAGPPDEKEPIEFKANEPFTYFIVDYQSDEILFAGRYVK